MPTRYKIRYLRSNLGKIFRWYHKNDKNQVIIEKGMGETYFIFWDGRRCGIGQWRKWCLYVYLVWGSVWWLWVSWKVHLTLCLCIFSWFRLFFPRILGCFKVHVGFCCILYVLLLLGHFIVYIQFCHRNYFINIDLIIIKLLIPNLLSFPDLMTRGFENII